MQQRQYKSNKMMGANIATGQILSLMPLIWSAE